MGGALRLLAGLLLVVAPALLTVVSVIAANLVGIAASLLALRLLAASGLHVFSHFFNNCIG